MSPDLRSRHGRIVLAAVTLGAAVIVATANRPARAQAPGSTAPDASFRLYLAATAAAEASLRLHETGAARRWLEEAPLERRGWEWRYLSAQADRSFARVEAHPGRVLDVALSPDGTRIVAAVLDQTLVRLDAR